MLSHGHWDHAGGIPRALGMIRAANGDRAVPLHLHPGMFDERGSRQPDGGVLPDGPRAGPARLGGDGRRAGGDAAEPYTIAGDLFWISGEIPRLTRL